MACQLVKKDARHRATCGKCLVMWTCKTHNVLFYAGANPSGCSEAEGGATVPEIKVIN